MHLLFSHRGHQARRMVASRTSGRGSPALLGGPQPDPRQWRDHQGIYISLHLQAPDPQCPRDPGPVPTQGQGIRSGPSVLFVQPPASQPPQLHVGLHEGPTEQPILQEVRMVPSPVSPSRCPRTSQLPLLGQPAAAGDRCGETVVCEPPGGFRSGGKAGSHDTGSCHCPSLVAPSRTEERSWVGSAGPTSEPFILGACAEERGTEHAARDGGPRPQWKLSPSNLEKTKGI